MCISKAPLTFMLKILLNLIINHLIGSSTKMNKSLQLCFRTGFLVPYFMTLFPNQYQNAKFLADPEQKIWKQNFKQLTQNFYTLSNWLNKERMFTQTNQQVDVIILRGQSGLSWTKNIFDLALKVLMCSKDIRFPSIWRRSVFKQQTCNLHDTNRPIQCLNTVTQLEIL